MTRSHPVSPVGPIWLAALATPAAAQGAFVDRTAEVGLVFETRTGLDTFENVDGGQYLIVRDWLQNGLSLGDLDSDGDLDVVLMGGLLENGVFRNDGGQFTDVSSTARLDARETDRVAALGDYDRDGDLDVFVGVAEGNGAPVPCPPGAEPPCFPRRGRLHANVLDQGRAFEFEEVTVLSDTRGNGQTVYAQWNDLDLDGRLDLYTAEFYLQPNAWYRNNGDGTFTELAAQRGLADAGSAHVAAGVDTDADGYPDVLVANDRLAGAALGFDSLELNPGDRYLHNDGDGTFTDLSDEVLLNQPKGVMGLAFGNVDYDQGIDVYKSNMQVNFLLLNKGAPGGLPWQKAQFEYGVDNQWLPHHDWLESPFAACAEQVHQEGCWGTSSGWATFFLNADLDPWLDLYVANGFVSGIKPWSSAVPRGQQNVLYRGLGPVEEDGAVLFPFADETEALGLLEFLDDRAGAVGDLDGDGDQDLLVMEASGALRYKENQLERNGQGWLAVRAETHTSAPGGVGTHVRWVDAHGGQAFQHLRVIGVDAPTASQSEAVAFFGLGTEPAVDLAVEFPSGLTRELVGVAANQLLTVVEPELVRLSTPKVFADGSGPTQVTVTTFAHHPDGSPGDGAAVVTIEAPGLAPLGPVAHVAGNEFTRDFDGLAAVPGEVRVRLGFDGWAPRIEPRVHVVGPFSSKRSSVVAAPQAVRADSVDEVVLWIAPKDVNGLSLGPGRSVIVIPHAPFQEKPYAAEDLGDGRYRLVLAAPEEPGVSDLIVSVDGRNISSTPLIEVGGRADAAWTEVRFEVAQPAQGMRPEEIKGVLTPRDALGRRLGPNALCELAVVAPPVQPGGSSALATAAAGLPGVGPVSVLPGFHARGQDDGDFVFVLARPSWLAAGLLPQGFLRVSVDGDPVATVPFDFHPVGDCPPDAEPGCETYTP